MTVVHSKSLKECLPYAWKVLNTPELLFVSMTSILTEVDASSIAPLSPFEAAPSWTAAALVHQVAPLQSEWVRLQPRIRVFTRKPARPDRPRDTEGRTALAAGPCSRPCLGDFLRPRAACTQVNVHAGDSGSAHSKFNIMFASFSRRARRETLFRNCLMNPSGCKLARPGPGWLLLDTSR